MSEQPSKNPILESGNFLYSLMMLAVIAMVVAIGGIGFVSVAKGNNATASASGASSTTVEVTLTEFAISMSLMSCRLET
jgi:hypothetical protein